MNTRGKGNAFERKVASMFTDGGFEVRGLEGQGDHLIVCRAGLVIASECKHQERLQFGVWWRQAIADAPASAVPVLTFRQNRTEPVSALRTSDLIRILGEHAGGAS